jgi:sugar diacid utilization regulator
VRRFANRSIDTPVATAPETVAVLAHARMEDVLALHQCDLLLDTLRTWFEAAGPATVLGERMFRHPNTVRQRLRRIEAFTRQNMAELLLA